MYYKITFDYMSEEHVVEEDEDVEVEEDVRVRFVQHFADLDTAFERIRKYCETHIVYEIKIEPEGD